MANYFATKTAQFKPFNYQEMLAPIMALKEDYEKTEKELSDLEDTAAAQAFTFQGSAYEDDYNKYIESLNNASNSMSVGNYNSDTKNKIKALRKQFLNTLAPAAQRITKLNALRTEQDTKQANNPFIKFSVDYRNKSEKDITANSTYSTYDLSKVYKQIAEDTLSRISQDYHSQVGDPVRIEGTNSYVVKHGYGLTPEQYAKQRADSNSDLSNFVNREIQKATQGIKEDTIKKEVEAEVENIIKSNIGKFDSTTVKGEKTSASDLFKSAEMAYKYNWGQDKDGNPYIIGLSDQYQLDRGWRRDINGDWYKPNSGGEEKKDTTNDYYDLKTMPSSTGGSFEIKNTDIDNKLRRDSKKPKVKATINGKSKSDLRKYSWGELQSLGIEDLDSEIIAAFMDNEDIKNAPYYDYYYEDTGGRGGQIHIVRKKDTEIEDTMVNLRTAEKRKEIAGITLKNGVYYFTDNNGKILLNPRRFGISLTPEEITRYKDKINMITREGQAVRINTQPSSNQNENTNTSNSNYSQENKPLDNPNSEDVG